MYITTRGIIGGNTMTKDQFIKEKVKEFRVKDVNGDIWSNHELDIIKIQSFLSQALAEAWEKGVRDGLATLVLEDEVTLSNGDKLVWVKKHSLTQEEERTNE